MLIKSLPLTKGKVSHRLFKGTARGLKIDSRACHNLLYTPANNNGESEHSFARRDKI